MAEEAQHGTQREQHGRRAHHTSINRHQQRRCDQHHRENAAPAEPVGKWAEREIPGESTDLQRHEVRHRLHDRHPRPAPFERRREQVRQPEEQSPVRELEETREHAREQRAIPQCATEEDAIRIRARRARIAAGCDESA